MFTLQKDNVVKLTTSEVKRDRYIELGYRLIEDNPAEEQSEYTPNENPPANGESPAVDNPETDKAEEKPSKKKA